MEKNALQFHPLLAPAPKYNLKATVVACPDTDYVFVYGGFDEYENLDSKVYLLNMATHTWEVDTAHEALYREGHLAVYIGNGNILVFGGVPEPENGEGDLVQGDTEGNDGHAAIIGGRVDAPRLLAQSDASMMVYSVISRRWQAAEPRFLVNAPSSRSRHACCLLEDLKTVFISGGLVNSTALSDLYSYDMATGVWLGPVEFVAQFDHLIFVHDGRLYASGGLDADMNHVTSKVLYLNLKDDSFVTVEMGAPREVFGGPLAPFPVKSNNFDRFWLDLGECCVKLEVSLPSWGLEISGSGVLVFKVDLRSFSRSELFLFSEICDYIWSSQAVDISLLSSKHCFVYKGCVHFLMEELETKGLSTLLSVSLGDLGVAAKSTGSVSSDLKNLLLEGQHTDYRVLTLRDEKRNITSISEADEEDIRTLPVHKSILIARWPHFRRIMESGMDEANSQTLFIPESYNTVWILIFYVYTGKLPGKTLPIADYSRLLILANLYELSELRLLVLGVLYSTLDDIAREVRTETGEAVFQTLLDVWTNVYISNEDMLIMKIEGLLKDSWPTLTRLVAFLMLSKDKIVTLCQNCCEEKHTRSRSSTKSLLRTPEPKLSPKSNPDSPFLRAFPQFPVSPGEEAFPIMQCLPSMSP